MSVHFVQSAGIAIDAYNYSPNATCSDQEIERGFEMAKALGASEAVVLNYADSGDVSGDKSSVVGYLAAAFGAAA